MRSIIGDTLPYAIGVAISPAPIIAVTLMLTRVASYSTITDLSKQRHG
jgi:hypothetical protein